MLVTNNTNSAVGIAGVSIPKRQQRTIRDWDRVKDTRRVRELLESGSISVPSVEPEPEPEPVDEPEEQPRRGIFGGLGGPDGL